MRAFAFIALVCMAIPATAAPIRLAGTTAPGSGSGAVVVANPAPGNTVAGWLPTVYDLTVDPVAGTVQLDTWAVFAPDGVEQIYTAPPELFVLEMNELGEFVGTPADGRVVVYYPPGRLPHGGISIHVHYLDGPTFDRPLLPQYPTVQPYRLATLVFDTPEPAGWGMAAAALAVVGWCRRAVP